MTISMYQASIPPLILSLNNLIVILQKGLAHNVHLHTTTAYNILRHSGVELGKKDFLGNP